MLKKDIKISIIIPAYNLEQYIRKCLFSIINQTYENLEIIVIDDGSKDNTSQIIDELALQDSRIIPIHQDNKGVFIARLLGIEHSTGDWIGFVDGDDEIEANMYELLLTNAIDNNVDISHCGYQMIYPDRIDYFYNTKQRKYQNNHEGLKDLLLGVFIEPGLCNKLFKRELFAMILKNDIFQNKIAYNEDLLMNYYLFKNARASYFEDVCPYHYILRKNSATKSDITEAKLSDPLRVIKIIKKDYIIKDDINIIIIERYVRQLINIVTTDIKGASNPVKNYVKETKKYFKQNINDIRSWKISNKIRFLAFWSCYSSGSYRFVHQMYAKVKGIDNKYKL